MSPLQTLQLSHLPESLALHVALYRDLKNAPFLREQLLSGNTEFEYAFIDASMVLSTTHVLAAAFRAVNDYANQRLKSRNVHSEIVFSLSPNNNIAESFRRFGVTDTTRDLLVIKVSTSSDITNDSVSQHLNRVVDAKSVPFSDESLEAISDVDKIAKAYKLGSLSNANPKGKGQADYGQNSNALEAENDRRKRLQTCIIGSIALRGAV